MCHIIHRIARKITKWCEEDGTEDADVIAFLRCPYAELVDFAVGLANLTRKEAAVVRLCGRLKYTQPHDCRRDAVQRRRGAAMVQGRKIQAENGMVW